MAKKGQKDVSDSFKQKHRKNKRNKTELVFDEAAREDWLTGFKKRKDERRKQAKKEEIEKLREEKRELKKKKREERAEEVASMRKVVGDCHPELAVIAEPKKYDLATHTVTITDITDVDYIGATGLRLGVNNNEEEKKTESKENVDEKGESEEADDDQSRKISGKRKPKGKRHKNLTHLMDKRRIVKRRKPTARIGNKRPGKKKR